MQSVGAAPGAGAAPCWASRRMSQAAASCSPRCDVQHTFRGSRSSATHTSVRTARQRSISRASRPTHICHARGAKTKERSSAARGFDEDVQVEQKEDVFSPRLPKERSSSARGFDEDVVDKTDIFTRGSAAKWAASAEWAEPSDEEAMDDGNFEDDAIDDETLEDESRKDESQEEEPFDFTGLTFKDDEEEEQESLEDDGEPFEDGDEEGWEVLSGEEAEFIDFEEENGEERHFNEPGEEDFIDFSKTLKSEAGPATGKRLPAEMRCFDTAKIYVQGGDGGRGCVAFRREKFVPKGGPSGGNGGSGGNVWAVADASLNSLSAFRGQVHFRAKPGGAGSGQQKSGRGGVDRYVRLPLGTLVRRAGAPPDEPPLAELLEPGSRALLAAGGRGGRGNLSFKTARNNAPALAERGQVGANSWLELELRLVADVGIVGVPNAGKSTLLSVASAARPKIANYPFTTLVPNLGVVELDYRSAVWCDIPGLMEGAHTGAGLGHEFLRHCQRCRLLVHVVDGSSQDPCGDYVAIQQELGLFSPALAEKRQLVAYNKMDLPDSADYQDDVQDFFLEQGVAREDIFAISAVTGQGVKPLIRAVREALDELPEELPFSEGPRPLNLQQVPRTERQQQLGDFRIEADLAGPRTFTVTGAALERFTQMTNWDYYEATRRFQKVLESAGVVKALEQRGVTDGDFVKVGEMEFEWSSDRSEGKLFDKWAEEQKKAGRILPGSARWPHAGV